jgi:heptosyltransferase-2/heptosyltransferase-3
LGREFGFLALCAGIKRRIGFDYRGRGLFLNEKKHFEGYENKPVADSQLELLANFGIKTETPVGTTLPFNISEEFEKRASLFFQHEALADARSFIALAPGGGRSWGTNAVYKQWDADKFALTANAWCAESKAALFLIGDETEKELLESVRRKVVVPNKIVCGQSLGVVAALLKRVRFLLGNDGGLTHLAHSLGVPTVSIFGPVNERVYGPYGTHTPHEIVVQPVPCRPCYARFYFPPCPHQRRCLEELSPQKVLAAIAKIS